jgi:MSHA biogenesis protein MshM
VYEAHFGLNRRPFGETVAPSAWISLPSRESVTRRLRYGLEQGEGPALLFGPAGSGKTLLARALARELGVASAHLTFPAMPTDELVAYLAEELGAGQGPSTIAASLRRVQRRLAETAAKGGRALLVVDEAQLIEDAATFEVLRALQNFATQGAPDLMVLFVGTAEVLLRMPQSLADRLAARCLLGPLSEEETGAYLHGRVAAAGATSDTFAPEAIAALHRASAGLPRRLNRLADFALLVAYAEGLDRPDVRSVNVAARELDPDMLAA